MALGKSPADLDFVPTIYDDDDIGSEEEEHAISSDENASGKKRKRVEKQLSRKKQRAETHISSNSNVADDSTAADGEIDPDFEFQMEDGIAEMEDYGDWVNGAAGTELGTRTLEQIVADRQKSSKGAKADDVDDDDEDEVELSDEELLADDAFGMAVDDDAEEEGEENDEDDEEEDEEDGDGSADGHDDDDEIAEPRAHPDDLIEHDRDGSDDESSEDEAEAARKKAFFAPESVTTNALELSRGSFVDFHLSRPMLRGLTSLGFSNPTPIQAKTIPIALEGKDVVGSAVTGSGKTAAFMIPILERLYYRNKDHNTTRVVILMPTRELALQCFNVATKLASFTDITFGQAIGGLNQRVQETALKQRPDIVIATPGRFIDIMRNTTALQVDAIEILVLDEADRMLEDGFADELNEILTSLPKSRQTMLFSATMTSSVDDLIRVGCVRPVRLAVDSGKRTVKGLVQEFVRLRQDKEHLRLAYLLHLVSTSYRQRTIIFFRAKVYAHRVRVLFALLGLQAAELHGALTQDQRIAAVESFRSGKAAFLLATDLASRGLDIKNVDAVINFDAPSSHEIYLHRVGRTARAGRSGQSCTLTAEGDRKVVRAAVKAAKAQGAIVKSRSVPAEEAEKWLKKITSLEDEIEAVLKEEKEERVLRITEMQARRADNIMTHEKEILARPKKTWFQGEKEKAAAKEKGKAVNIAGLTGMDAKVAAEMDKLNKKRKMSNKQKKRLALKDERKEGRMWKKGSEQRGKKEVASKSGAKKATKGKPKGNPKGKFGRKAG